MFYAILAVLLVLLDQVVKYLVRAGIPLGGSVPFLPHVLQLTYVQNTWASFSLFREHTWVLTLFSAVLVLVVAWLIVRRHISGRLGVFSAMLIMAGGVGNLIDRVLFGYVTDMFQTLFMDFPVFNVADCCITVGVVLLFIYVLFFYDKDKKKEEVRDDAGDLPSDGQ